MVTLEELKHLPVSLVTWFSDEDHTYKFIVDVARDGAVMLTLADEESGVSYSLLSGRLIFSDTFRLSTMVKAMIEQVRNATH